jgi:hypothetical protein
VDCFFHLEKGTIMTPPTGSDSVESIFKSIISNAGKSGEKALIYGLALMTSTNIFGTTPIGLDLKGVVIGSLALVAAALHISTPTPKSGPSQL